MLVPSILALLVGIPLGLRFKVLILAPASLAALLFVICAAILRADTPWNIGLSAAATIACLQVGYVAGLVILSRVTSAGPGRLSWFHGRFASARGTAQTSRGQHEVGLVTYGRDTWGACLNEEFCVTSPPSAPFASPDVENTAPAGASHLD